MEIKEKGKEGEFIISNLQIICKKIKKIKEIYMNVATYVYIVHSDINENNIYAEFATEEEAIDYARRHKDELTYVESWSLESVNSWNFEQLWVYEKKMKKKKNNPSWNKL